MRRTRKRKQPPQLGSQSKRSPAKSAVNGAASSAMSDEKPYLDHHRPTPDECRAIRDELLSLHGFPPEFAKYRRQRLRSRSIDGDQKNYGCQADVDRCNYLKVERPDDHEDDGEVESVLDGLVKTVLSQNTTEINSRRAFASLKAEFPTWEDVHAAEPKLVENAVRCGGLAPRKTTCIKNLLNSLLEKKGKLCLEYLRELSLDEVKTELSCFKGIGPKTVSCVLLFNLQLDDFPVDTHVFEISRAMGWIPTSAADRNKAYLHLNRRIPDELKFDLNILLYTHGKLCRECTRKTNVNSRGSPCPLLDFIDCSKSNRHTK